MMQFSDCKFCRCSPTLETPSPKGEDPKVRVYCGCAVIVEVEVCADMQYVIDEAARRWNSLMG